MGRKSAKKEGRSIGLFFGTYREFQSTKGGRRTNFLMGADQSRRFYRTLKTPKARREYRESFTQGMKDFRRRYE